MRLLPTDVLPDVVEVLSTADFCDNRGSFQELYRANDLEDLLETLSFKQENLSRSYPQALRGLHYQMPPLQVGKLITCLTGLIFDIAVDLRYESKTFGKWVGVKLFGPDHSLWIPPGFAHGFYSLSKSVVLYRQTEYYNRAADRTISWRDPALNISWPLIESLGDNQPTLSNKDRNAPFLEEVLDELKTARWKTL